MRVRNIRYLGLFLLGLLCDQCVYDVDGSCGCCCQQIGGSGKCRYRMVNNNMACSGRGQSNGMLCPVPMITPVCTCCMNCSKDMGRCMNESYSTAMPDSSSGVTVVVVSSCVVIVVIAILITACYWIHKKHKGNGSNSMSSTVKYVADNENVKIKGETCAATQHLPPAPVDNNYIPSTSQQHTYEQIDPEYRGFQQAKQSAGGAYTTLQLNDDSIHNCNFPATIDISETTNLKTGKSVSKDKPTPAYYTLQRDENSDVTETAHTTDANDDGEADNYAILRQSDTEEEAYNKLNHNAHKSFPDDSDITDDYNKLIHTPEFDEESEDYSHLNRTSLNLDESVQDPGYCKLNLSKDEPAESTAKSDVGYEETLPGDVKPKYATPGVSEQLKDDNRVEIANNRVEKANNRVEKANINNGYEEAIIKN